MPESSQLGVAEIRASVGTCNVEQFQDLTHDDGQIGHNSWMALQRDIARSHLETLIERLTGVDKALPDADGDYFIPTQSAGFFARVDGDDAPVIRLFSVIATDVAPSPELFEAVNSMNTKLSFLRAMHVSEQVLIEGEVLALRADLEDFRSICQRVAHASDHFGPQVIEQFGGKALFDESKSPDYTTPDPPVPGYL